MTKTNEITIDVTKILTDGMLDLIEVEADDEAVERLSTVRGVCGTFGQESDNSGCWALVDDDAFESVSDWLEEAEGVESYRVVNSFCDANNYIPSEILPFFAERMRSHTRLLGTYYAHYVVSKSDVQEALADAVHDWIMSL